MHRRGGGIAALQRQEQNQRSFVALSHALSQSQVDHLHAQLTHFRTALARFAATHRHNIRRDPAFRHAFQQMCSSIGVDPLAGPRKGGWWAEMLGMADWQHELGVQIVDVCVTTRDRNGGLIDIAELIRLVTKLRGLAGGAIDEDDVVRSIKSLQPLGAGYHVVDIAGRKMVRSVVNELDDDQTVILAIATELGGRIVPDVLVERKSWSRERTAAALENMLTRDGLCWIDEQDEQCGRAYWVPSAIKWDE
ncbi:EAP30/Vps36 family-domain-containing protein [Armillaria borealis]|uniref:EAP30/Vps36 family-domain-containing protein n=1 Tax=Armillaria borealis TaxID=47425 RepID=A0AA39JX95_9AGAR|nr:EAP30/Vps36 family-domain-containing protein [Armillaria borealis]